MADRTQIILIMGVAGSGKSTIGQRLAQELAWPYYEADDFHSAANKAKMSAGTPLTDDDRAPWLAAIRAEIDRCIAQRECAVFTCSGLKDHYRRVLLSGAPEVTLVYLHGDADTLFQRLSQRSGHFMKPAMLQSQLDALEVPSDALTLDIRETPADLVATIRQRLAL
jgi:gluconokinase